MRFDMMLTSTPDTVVQEIRDVEQSPDLDGAWVIDTKHDPFLLMGAAAATGAGVRIGTAVAVAFARSPMLLAQTGWDLQGYSGGRFALGLGTQVPAHITRRFSMPWGKPVGQMRELIEGLHAIWDAWEGKRPLEHHGEYYRLDLMTPAFTPAEHGFGRPPVLLGALGPAMTALAGEVADGFIVHRFMTRSFLEDVTLPRLEKGKARRETDAADFEVVMPAFYTAPKSAGDLDDEVHAVRKQIAFYASTPSYSPVLEHHGWESVGQELNAMSKRGEWEKMADLITDEMLEAFAVLSTHDDLRADLTRRYEGLVDRVVVFAPGTRA